MIMKTQISAEGLEEIRRASKTESGSRALGRSALAYDEEINQQLRSVAGYPEEYDAAQELERKEPSMFMDLHGNMVTRHPLPLKRKTWRDGWNWFVGLFR